MGTFQEHYARRHFEKSFRLYDLEVDQRIIVKCICGRSAHFMPGVLQRLHKLPSDTLVYDLRFRLRCRKCNSRDGIKVSVERVTNGW